MTTKDDVTRKFQQLFDSKEIVGKYWNALVGDGAGTIADADNPALTWVRYLTDQSKTSKVVNPLNLALVEDIPVIVGRRFPDTEYEEILAVNVGLYIHTMDEAAVEAYSHGRHGDDHNAATGTDPTSIDLRNLVEMRGRPRTVPDKTIFVEKGQYQFGNVIKRFPTGIIDLTASIPGGVGHRYVLVYVDGATNLLGSTDSIVVPLAAAPPIPAVPVSTISICVVDLEFNQVEITEDDIFDWRFLWRLASFTAPAFVGTNAARLLLVLADLAELTRFYTTDTDKIWEVWEGAWRLIYPPAALSESDGDAGTPWTTDAVGALTGTRNLILDDGAGDSPILRFVGGSNNDRIDFSLLDDGVAGRSDLILQLADASAQSQFKIINTDAFTAVSIDSQGGAVFNEHSYDVDFRVEGNGDADLFFVDGGTDRIGIGTNAPESSLHVQDEQTQQLLLENMKDDVSNPSMVFRKTRGVGKTAVDGDYIGTFGAKFWNDAGAPEEIGSFIYARVDDVTDGTEDTSWYITNMIAGVSTIVLAVKEGDVGIGIDSPYGKLHAVGNTGGVIFWDAETITGVLQTILPAGSVNRGMFFSFVVTQKTLGSPVGTDMSYGTMYPNATGVLFSDGTNTLTLACTAGGAVTIQRTAGTEDFALAIWIVYD